MQCLLDKNRIQTRISEMAQEIDAYYQKQSWYRYTNEPVVVIGILTGSVFFMTDLLRQLHIRVKMDFMRTSTYPGRATTPQNEARLIQGPVTHLHDAHVLLIDDILDTGITLQKAYQYIADHYIETIKTAVLLRKPGKAPEHIKADFVGFDIPDEWVIGYGLDYNGLCRHWPDISIWSEHEHTTSKRQVKTS